MPSSTEKKIQSQQRNGVVSLFNSNKRLLGLLTTKNLISREQYAKINTILEEDINAGKQKSVEQIIEAYQIFPAEIINKELFKYNQIIIKLAQQFIKNTMIHKLSIEQESQDSISVKLEQLEKRFSSLVASITEDYVNGFQKDIDGVLIETGLIETQHLLFLHNGAKHLEIKALDRKFGEIAVNNQFTTKTAVNQALTEQTDLYLKTNKNYMIGDILVRQKKITPETRDEILLLQNRIQEEDWEETLRRVGQSEIEEQEKNALFGAMVIKENLIKEEKVIEALKIQAHERETYKKKQQDIDPGAALTPQTKPRWIGDILVDDFGLSEKDRKRIVKKQMQQKIEMINLKFGFDLKNAHRELFNELDTYFKLSYSKNRLRAYIELKNEIPASMTKDNIVLWLYHQRIIYGRISSAVQYLLEKKVNPGQKILIAKGEDPVPDSYTPIFHFNLSKDSNAPQTTPSLVTKGTPLITMKRTPGESGINVNRCFVSAPNTGGLTIIKGANVFRENNLFIASCDGVPHFSEKNVISISPKIIIPGDLTKDCPPINHDCDVEVLGTIESDLMVNCRKLTVHTLKGRASCSDKVTVKQSTQNAQLKAKGIITIASALNSNITGEKSVFIEHIDKSNNLTINEISNSMIFSDDVCSISNAALSSSIIRARNKIILRKIEVGKNCKFIIGDSTEVFACKIRIEELANLALKCLTDIQDLQSESQELFGKMEKKDISDIENQLNEMNRRGTKTKEDLDRIRDLKRIKRQKEKELEKKYNDYADLFVEISNGISDAKKRKADYEKQKQELTKKIMLLYKEEAEIPELDARRATIPQGTIVQFRHSKGKIDSDYKGFVFREEFNTDSQTYEIRKHRW